MEFDVVPGRSSEEKEGNFYRECRGSDGEQRSPQQGMRLAGWPGKVLWAVALLSRACVQCVAQNSPAKNLVYI